MDPNTDDGAVVDLVLSKLDGVVRRGGYWMARCPAHEDNHPSLSVKRGTAQPVLLHCQAGCEFDDVTGALGLTRADLCAPESGPDGVDVWTPRGPAVAVYPYRDEAGALLFEVCRTLGKEFPCRVADPSKRGGYRWSLAGVRRVPYALPELLAGIAAGRRVWITEGEKDANRLRSAGECATTWPGGAAKAGPPKWRAEYDQHFAGADVGIVADCDDPGRREARHIADQLAGTADRVTLYEPAEGKDVSDHLDAGRKLAELVVTRPADDARPQLAMDLTAFLAVEYPPEDWVIKGILERGDRLIWTAPEGFGKSTVIRQMCMGAASGLHPFGGWRASPRRVLFVDCENSAPKSQRRFRPLAQMCADQGFGVPDGGLIVVHLTRGIDLTREEGAAFLWEQVTAHRPDLLYVGPLYKLHSLDSNDETAARAILAVLDEAMARADCALITEAHCAKGGSSTTSRALDPAGSRLFMAWPDSGYGFRPVTIKTRRLAKVSSWRGDREERDFPAAVGWGRGPLDWPWVPVTLTDDSGQDQESEG